MKNAALLTAAFISMLLLSAVAGTNLAKPAISETITIPDDYSTIQEAIKAANEGDTIFIKKGTYEGPINQTLVINKTVSLIGEDAKNTIINLHPPLVPKQLFTLRYMVYSHSIKIEANGFKLANLTISGGGGISVTGNATEIIGNVIRISISVTGNTTQITDNIISSGIFSTGDCTRITGNTVQSIDLNGSNQTIMQNTITGTATFLISCVGSNNNIALNNVTGTGGGVYIKGSHNVIQENIVTTESLVEGGLNVEGDRNTISKNSYVNFVRIEGSSNVVFGNMISSNLGVVGNDNVFFLNYLRGLVLGNSVQDASNNTFYHNNFDFLENKALPAGEKVFTVWGGVKGDNFLDNGREGNFWSDYDGIDWTLDGIGDMPYVIDAKDPRNYHNMAEFNVADVVLIDHHPIMTPFDISNASTEETFRIPWTFVIISTVIGASLVVYFKKRKR